MSSQRSQLLPELLAPLLIQPHLLQPGAVSGLPAALELPLGPQRGGGGGRSLLLLLPLPLLLLLLALPPPPSSPSSEAFLPLPRAHQRLGGLHVPASSSCAEPSGAASPGALRRGRSRPRGPGPRLALLGLQHAVVSAPQSAAAAAALPLAALRPAAVQTGSEETPRPGQALRPTSPGLHQDDSGTAEHHAARLINNTRVKLKRQIFSAALFSVDFRRHFGRTALK